MVVQRYTAYMPYADVVHCTILAIPTDTNVQQNDGNKFFRLKMLRAKEKYSLVSLDLASFAPLRSPRVIMP